MNKIKLLSAALLALAAVATSHAITVSASDLILGFSRSSTGTGNATSLEVNLGSAASLVTASGGAEITLSQLAVGDLETYGAAGAWRNANTTWGVVGATDVGDNLVWGTVKGGSVVGAPGANQGSVSNNVQALYTSSAGGLAGESATANSASAALVQNTGANAWKTKATTNLNFSYSPWTGKLTQTTASLASVAFQASDLYSFVEGGAATLLGTFKLYSDGAFTFTSFAAIPEPSTYAGLLGVVTLGIVAIRRRRQAAVEV